ncbi:MAG TPA: DoxX family protein [Geobacterales bacterium]|nr:DoxX family protein [Geobacterales bacterium]
MANLYDSLSLLALRIPLGIIFIAHGSQKLFGLFGGGGLTQTIHDFEQQLGIPPILTILAIVAEFGGGIGILLGILTRLSAIGLAIDMVVAIVKVHLANGLFLNFYCVPNQGHGFEYNLALLGMAVYLALRGGGSLALDRLFWEKL